jgi:hypothetical protein
MGKDRNAGEGATGLSKSSVKKGARKSAVKKAKPTTIVESDRAIRHSPIFARVSRRMPLDEQLPY